VNKWKQITEWEPEPAVPREPGNQLSQVRVEKNPFKWTWWWWWRKVLADGRFSDTKIARLLLAGVKQQNTVDSFSWKNCFLVSTD